MSERNSKEEWAERLKRNAISQQMGLIREAAEELVKPNGEYHALLISGPPGLGKNHTFNAVFAKAGIVPRTATPGSNLGLIEELYEARDGIVLFDEADKVWDGDTINTLKKALDPVPANRWVQNNIVGKHKKDEPKNHLTGMPFLVRCKTVFLTNKDLNNSMQFPTRTRVHLPAVRSRIPVFTITFDIMATWEYTCGLAIVEGLLKKHKHSLVTANLALDYFTRTMWVANDASPRRLEEIAKTIRAHPQNWKAVLDMRLPQRGLRGEGPVPSEIPQIILPPKAA